MIIFLLDPLLSRVDLSLIEKFGQLAVAHF